VKKLLLGLLIAPIACFALDNILPPKSYKASEAEVAQWQVECQKRINIKACFNLGVYYAQQVGDDERARDFYIKSCNQNYGLGCFNLGGILIKQDASRDMGADAFQKACDLLKDPAESAAVRDATRPSCRLAKTVKANLDVDYKLLVKKLSREL
jgi:TPR repeat protein